MEKKSECKDLAIKMSFTEIELDVGGENLWDLYVPKNKRDKQLEIKS